MEKGNKLAGNQITRIVLTGPECSGKTTLTKELAGYFNTFHIPEYARDYIGNLCRPYQYADLEHIAEVQRKQAHHLEGHANPLVFLDTYLIITKIWFKVVFGRYPEWIDTELAGDTIDFYLLCDTSIPWTSDPVRENGGAMREKLFLMYRKELEYFGCRYQVITGTGQQRMDQAIGAIQDYLSMTGKLNNLF